MVTAGAGVSGQLEPLAVPRHPLDMLCQQLVGMAVQGSWTPAAAFAVIRRAYPFRDLALSDFVDCLHYLSGGPASAEVPSRLRWHDHCFRVASARTARIYRRNAGTIIAEGDRTIRMEDGSPVGQVSEFFAGRLHAGDRFLLGGRCLQVTGGDTQELRVREAPGRPAFTHWEGNLWPLSPALAERIWLLRLRAKEALLEGPDQLRRLLRDEYQLGPEPLEELLAYFQEQETVSEIPAQSLLVEATPELAGDGQLYCFHLALSGPACEAVGRVLAWRLGGTARLRTTASCLGFVLAVAADLDLEPNRLYDLLSPSNFARDLERAVADSPILGRRFATVAQTGLMLLRQPLGPRRRVGGRDWASRRLFHWLRFVEPEFPLLRQAWREVRDEVLTAPDAITCLERLSRMPIHVRWLPQLSPFAASWGTIDHQLSRVDETSAQPSAPASQCTDVYVHGDWLLTPSRAAFHVPSRTAVVADLHLDYAAMRQTVGEAVPVIDPQRFWDRLHALVTAYRVDRLVVAGDLVENARCLDTARQLAFWLAGRGIAFELVPGNHDRGLPALPGMTILCHGLQLGGWHIVHEADPSCGSPQVTGHIHPVVRGLGVAGTAACYLVSPQGIVLPAFSDEAAGLDVRRVADWRNANCYAIVEEAVCDLGLVRDLGMRRSQRTFAATASSTGQTRSQP
jgi:metallophosphoesterase superfamily enzyme